MLKKNLKKKRILKWKSEAKGKKKIKEKFQSSDERSSKSNPHNFFALFFIFLLVRSFFFRISWKKEVYVRLKVDVYLCRVVVGYKEKTRRSVRWIKQQRKNKPVFSSVRFAAGAKKCKKRSNSWNSFLSVFFHLNSSAYIFKTNLKKKKLKVYHPVFQFNANIKYIQRDTD